MFDPFYNGPERSIPDACLIRRRSVAQNEAVAGERAANYVYLSFLDQSVAHLATKSTPFSAPVCIMEFGPEWLRDEVLEVAIHEKYLLQMFESLLGRKVFTSPEFVDRPEINSAFLGPVLDILGRIAKIDPDWPDRKLGLRNMLLEKLVNHVATGWGNNHTAELQLSASNAPPLALRLALDYITAKRGIVDKSQDVAEQTHVGLRALERMFRQWLGMGIAQYCKLQRLQQVTLFFQREGIDLSLVARRFRFSNLTRLRRELEGLDQANLQQIRPADFYQLLAERQFFAFSP